MASINGIAIAAYRRGDLRAAAAAFSEARSAWAARLGADHHLTLTASNNLAVALSESGALA